MDNKKKVSPWAWIPSLYFAQGLPYVAVMTISVIMYKRLGISNTDIALYTGWLYLPWVIKPFWSPFVDTGVCSGGYSIYDSNSVFLPTDAGRILDRGIYLCHA